MADDDFLSGLMEWGKEVVEDEIIGPLKGEDVTHDLKWTSDSTFEAEIGLVSEVDTEEIYVPGTNDSYFDMKPRLLKNARIGEDGMRYQIIPITGWKEKGVRTQEDAEDLYPDLETKHIPAEWIDEEIYNQYPDLFDEEFKQTMREGQYVGELTYTWESHAYERMNELGYRNLYHPEDRYKEDAEPYGREEGVPVTFRTVTNQPKQAGAWWYRRKGTPGRWVRAVKRVSRTAIEHLRWLGALLP